MRDVNKIILLGRLGTNPIQRETKNGTPVVHFSLATSRKTVSNEAEGDGPTSKEETQWHQIVAWGKQGESCAQYLSKGQTVFIEGSLRSHAYVNKSGEKKTSYEIHVDNMSFLGLRKKMNPLEEVAEAAAS
jgi:single-strand DNA-binding protein